MYVFADQKSKKQIVESETHSLRMRSVRYFKTIHKLRISSFHLETDGTILFFEIRNIMNTKSKRIIGERSKCRLVSVTQNVFYLLRRRSITLNTQLRRKARIWSIRMPPSNVGLA